MTEFMEDSTLKLVRNGGNELEFETLGSCGSG
jgi:hypothetical protein